MITAETSTAEMVKCPMCAELFEPPSDPSIALCEICRMDTRETSELWDAIRLAHFPKVRSAQIEDELKTAKAAAARTRQLTEAIVERMTDEQKATFNWWVINRKRPAPPPMREGDAVQQAEKMELSDWEKFVVHKQSYRCRFIIELCSKQPTTVRVLHSAFTKKYTYISLATFYRDVEMLLKTGALKKCGVGMYGVPAEVPPLHAPTGDIV